MSKPHILGTGLNGLVGSKLLSDWSEKYQFENLDISDPTHPVDITDRDQVMAAVSASAAEVIVHFAAYTDVTGAWNQRDDKTGPAYRVNVLGTENLVAAAAANGKYLIHVSTAYVFNGEKESPYVETDPMSPIEWYGQTKAWAEEKVAAGTNPWVIFRIDQPFRSDVAPRPDVVRRIITGMKEGTLYPQFTDHYFGPTFIDDFSRVIEWAIRQRPTGIYHASNGEQWTDFAFAEAIKNRFGLEFDLQAGDLEAYLAKSNRPYQRNTSLNCSKLFSQLDFKPHTISEALALVQPE